MDLYYASTPYNILLTLFVKSSREENADLIISDFSAANEAIANNIKKTGMFKNVYFVNQKKHETVEMTGNKLVRIIKKIKNRVDNRFFFKKIIKKDCNQLDINKKYDLAFFDATNYLQRAIFYNYKKNNKRLKFYKIDCGIESYYNMSNLNVKFKSIRDVTKKMMKSYLGSYLIDNRFCLFNNYPSFSIPKDNIDINLINEVFQFDNFDFFNKGTNFYFDQKMDYESWSNKQNEIVEYLTQIDKDLVIKLHPRTEADNYKNCIIVNTKTTFELLVLNSKNINYDDLVLITPLSTSVFLPKMLLDKEPYIICLMDVMELHWSEEEPVRDFFRRAIDVYSNKNKIFIPSNMNELKEIINNVCRRRTTD